MLAREPNAWDRLMDTAAREANERAGRGRRARPIVTRRAFSRQRRQLGPAAQRVIGGLIGGAFVGLCWAAPTIHGWLS